MTDDGASCLSAAGPPLPGARLRGLPRRRGAVQGRADGDVQVSRHGDQPTRTSAELEVEKV